MSESIDTLKSDFAAIQSKIDAMSGPLTTAPEIMSLLKNDLVPFIGEVVKEVGEVDEAVADMYAQAEDILQPETAAEVAALILTGRTLVKELMTLNPKAAAACKAWLQLSKTVEETLAEITVDDPSDDDEDDEDEDDEDNEDERDEGDDKHDAKKEG